jgi:hypothetical protein
MTIFPTWLRTGLLGIVLATGAMNAPVLGQTTAQPAQPALPAQATYATPDEAAAALADAARQGGATQLRAVLGPGSEQLITSGDPVADAESRARFLTAYDEQHALAAEGPDRMTLQVGRDAWQLPIPLVKADSRWHFDSNAGAQELVDRRIGRNEISAIKVMLAYVASQKAYYEMTGKTGHAVYAERVISRPGRHDGLYWPAQAGQEPSPLADLVAQAEAEGYPSDLVSGVRTPYLGYLYRILKGQGPEAPGGAKSYIQRGLMVGGYAMVAWPASYGASGIMTFIVDQDGVVFQRDLGPTTDEIARAMPTYNPDLRWGRVDIVGQ